MNHVMQRNAMHLALIQVAQREHSFLVEAQKQDGFKLGEIEILDGTDEELHVSFTLDHVGKQVFFTYSLGFDADEGGYLPYVEVDGGEATNPQEFSTKQLSGDSYVFKQRDVLNAIGQLDSSCGECRYLAFQWLQNFAKQ